MSGAAARLLPGVHGVPALAMRDAEASLPPDRLPAAGNVLLTAAESLNEDDL